MPAMRSARRHRVNRPSAPMGLTMTVSFMRSTIYFGDRSARSQLFTYRKASVTLAVPLNVSLAEDAATLAGIAHCCAEKIADRPKFPHSNALHRHRCSERLREWAVFPHSNALMAHVVRMYGVPRVHHMRAAHINAQKCDLHLNSCFQVSCTVHRTYPTQIALSIKAALSSHRFWQLFYSPLLSSLLNQNQNLILALKKYIYIFSELIFNKNELIL